MSNESGVKSGGKKGKGLAVVMTPLQVVEINKHGYHGVFPSSPSAKRILQFFLETNREIGKLNKLVLWEQMSVEEYSNLNKRIKEKLDAITVDIKETLKKGKGGK